MRYYHHARDLERGDLIHADYRTKDFRGDIVGECIVVRGTHSKSRTWLAQNAGNNYREQFMVNGELIAHGDVELESLIYCLQKEYKP